MPGEAGAPREAPETKGGDVSAAVAPIVTPPSTSKWYGQVIGLNDVTVSVPPGVTRLLGPKRRQITFMKRSPGSFLA